MNGVSRQIGFSARSLQANTDNVRTALTLGYYIDKTLILSMSKYKGRRTYAFTNGNTSSVDDDEDSFAMKYLKLLGNQAAISFYASYWMGVSTWNYRASTDSSSVLFGNLKYYFNQKLR